MIEYSGKSNALVKAVLSCSEGWLMKVAGVSDLTSKCKGPWCSSSVFQHVQLFHRIAGLNWMTQPWRFANQEQSQSDKQGYICRGNKCLPQSLRWGRELKPHFVVLKQEKGMPLL